jgi:AcrR family transcriptional regulator
LIAQKGPAGFTFAEAARWAGVSPAAPYRHFRDRDELIADVARRGFELFADALLKSWDDGRPDPFTAFDRLGKAYLAFARNEPAYYSAMFEAGIPQEADPNLRQAGDRAFAVLRTATEKLIATMPGPNRPPALMVSLHICRMAWPRCSGGGMRRAAAFLCLRRNCWRRECWCTCAGSASWMRLRKSEGDFQGPH